MLFALLEPRRPRLPVRALGLPEVRPRGATVHLPRRSSPLPKISDRSTCDAWPFPASVVMSWSGDDLSTTVETCVAA